MKQILFAVILLLSSCAQEHPSLETKDTFISQEQPSLIILGNVQDAGSPHIACTKSCCKDLITNPDPDRMVVSLAVIDPIAKKNFLLEATPDMPRQLKYLKKASPWEAAETPDGIFLTHAHIGHYTGLMYLGKEAMGAKNQPVYVMPAMDTFLRHSGPWSQLVTQENIALTPLENNKVENLTSSLSITPFLVPHRDEYSETVGFRITGKEKSALFIPDIDKWEKWEKEIINQIEKVEYAFIDGTFYDGNEIKNRDISEIPHPFIIESMEKFKLLPSSEKDKIYFIHLNHTNPALRIDSEQSKTIEKNGFHVARLGDAFTL